MIITYVTYEHNKKSEKDYQTEIELKSDQHIHKIELKNLADALIEELNIQKADSETESKYLKGLALLGLL